MKIVIISDNKSANGLASKEEGGEHEIVFQHGFENLPHSDVCIDLLFSNDELRIDQLLNIFSLVIINSVETELKYLPSTFVRINAWPGFLEKEIIEASSHDIYKEQVENIFSFFGKKIEWVPDVTGFITPRIISMIINEAYFTLEEKVSSKEEIDIAMKLGTNYPYGPFEWAEKIGLKNIFDLLLRLSEKNLRYTPAPLLRKEALH